MDTEHVGVSNNQGMIFSTQKLGLPGPSIAMPSAIARIYTPDGFAVAADGRMMRGDTIVSDEVQKIFCINEPRIVLAYAIAGIAEITADESGEIVFNFLAEMPKAILTLKRERFNSLWDYANAFATQLRHRLNATNETADASNQPQTHIFMDGYFGKQPRSVCIDWFYSRPAQTRFEVSSPRSLSQLEDYGSERVINLYRNRDTRFAAYITAPPSTGQEAVHAAINRVAVQCGPEALEIDPEHCRSIGGWIHAATVTYAQGFQWVPGHMPRQSNRY